MILPAVRERLEALLRHAAMEGALAAVRSGANHISITGLHDVAKALVAAYLTHALRRPAFFVTDSNRRAEALAGTLRFFSNIFPGATGGVATLPAFDRLPWESQSPHADILERRAATLFRVADGQVSFVIAPIAAALWRYQDPAAYLYLTRTLSKDAEIPVDLELAFADAKPCPAAPVQRSVLELDGAAVAIDGLGEAENLLGLAGHVGMQAFAGLDAI